MFHITDSDKFAKTFSTSIITKFAKENNVNISEVHKENVKAKKVFMVSVPHIIPIIVGNSIREGRSDAERSLKKSMMPIFVSRSICD